MGLLGGAVFRHDGVPQEAIVNDILKITSKVLVGPSRIARKTTEKNKALFSFPNPRDEEIRCKRDSK